MPTILEIRNPFDLSADTSKTYVQDGTNVREWLDLYLGKGKDFDHPTVLEVNGIERMRAEWPKIILHGNDSAKFKRLPAGGIVPFLVQSLVAGAVGAVVSGLFTPEFDARDEEPSVWNISGQKNSIKLGQVVQSTYGQSRIFPPYAARSYTKYIDNDQYLYQLFCVGDGEYDMTDFQIEDTPVSSFEGVTYETYDPGDDVTLFPDNVITSSEVASLELFDPLDPEYTSETGPFTANPSATDASVLEWDVVFPQGLYWVDSDGDLRSWTVTVNFSYREIDDAGDPVGVGTWTVVPFTKTLSTRTPQRFTVSTTVTPARYEVKAVRTGDYDANPTLVDTVQWYQLRAELPSTKDYGDVTLLAMVIKATNNLNSESQNKINLVGTRKLPIWNGTTWSANTATRSIVWAFCNVLRSSNGANLEDSKLDLPSLLTLDAVYSSRADTFDWTFDTETTRFKALSTIASAGRAKLIIYGNRFTMVRDAPQTVPDAAFSPENIKPNSWSEKRRLQRDSTYDGIRVSYTDANTRREETVDCLIGNDAGESLENITLAGITDRDKALREGLYIRAKQIFRTRTVQITTGKEGRIPVYGDLIALSYDFDLSQSGQVESIAVDNRTVTLKHPLTDHQGDRIAFRDKYGEIDGPYVCTTDAADLYTVETTSDIDGDLNFNANDEPPIYFFGTASTLYDLYTLEEKTTSGDDVTLTLANYDERIYQYDNYTAEPLPDVLIPDSPDPLPAITGLMLTQISDSPLTVQATWNLADGAQYYVYQVSYDNTSWSDLEATTANSANILADQGTFYFRVAAVNSGQGPWSTESLLVSYDTRTTSQGDTRTTSQGDTRITTQ